MRCRNLHKQVRTIQTFINLRIESAKFNPFLWQEMKKAANPNFSIVNVISRLMYCKVAFYLDLRYAFISATE